MLTRILAVATALLAALVVHQYSQIGQLRAEVANAEERGAMHAKSSLVDSFGGQGAEIQRTMIAAPGPHASTCTFGEGP